MENKDKVLKATPNSEWLTKVLDKLKGVEKWGGLLQKDLGLVCRLIERQGHTDESLADFMKVLNTLIADKDIPTLTKSTEEPYRTDEQSETMRKTLGVLGIKIDTKEKLF